MAELYAAVDFGLLPPFYRRNTEERMKWGSKIKETTRPICAVPSLEYTMHEAPDFRKRRNAKINVKMEQCSRIEHHVVERPSFPGRSRLI